MTIMIDALALALNAMRNTQDSYQRAKDAGRNDEAAHHADWISRHDARVKYLVRAYLPGGGGFDAGTELFKYDGYRVQFTCLRHDMDENGRYDGWTTWRVTVRAAVGGYEVRARAVGQSKRRHRDRYMREFVEETFHDAIEQDVPDGDRGGYE